ncbi:MAG: EamA family transporter, partial [Bacteroidales bacterium]|nr:EamA family transporter [Bacteroidales bacterium]
LWMYLLKNHDLSVIHPLSGASFIFSMILASAVFGESIPMIRWLGVALIIAGMYFIVLK